MFLDRDPKVFQTLFSYLRSGSKIYPVFESAYDEIYFANELEYWGLPPSE